MIYTSSLLLFWYVLWCVGFALPLLLVYKILDYCLDMLTGIFPKQS